MWLLLFLAWLVIWACGTYWYLFGKPSPFSLDSVRPPGPRVTDQKLRDKVLKQDSPQRKREFFTAPIGTPALRQRQPRGSYHQGWGGAICGLLPEVPQGWLGSPPYEVEAIVRIRISPDEVSERGLSQVTSCST
ncbi:hypothetical protein SKAU_G00135220 [Synaphobranchus kaupii]|uniref:ATP synthase F0 subunit 8 n=1 Tax=Synaphobranchus kaupii TaxID=118154 RepID=A0A9Q1FR63_SYNKA|nr:hypothetical protein SKAU_G00135220 [Synaphobranchus kaupii]